ncbi:MAG: hypothetical protein NPIRA05_01340 [Nitrospirales bacterium]|nr:MAG: hypothetical protein NPIRA05_01340 [Nitrospirales bacterium]
MKRTNRIYLAIGSASICLSIVVFYRTSDDIGSSEISSVSAIPRDASHLDSNEISSPQRNDNNSGRARISNSLLYEPGSDEVLFNSFEGYSVEELKESILAGDFSEEFDPATKGNREVLAMMSRITADAMAETEAILGADSPTLQNPDEYYSERWSSFVSALNLTEKDASVIEMLIVDLEKRNSEILEMWDSGDIDTQSAIELTDSLQHRTREGLSDYISVTQLADFDRNWNAHLNPSKAENTSSQISEQERIRRITARHARYGEVVELTAMLAAGADITSVNPESGETLLMSSSGAGQLESMAVLLDFGAKVDARSPSGETALITAVGNGQTEAVKLLLSEGADPNATDNAGRTPMLTALIFRELGENYVEIEELLLEAGAVEIQ